MGINFFYYWFKTNFNVNAPRVIIDNLFIDMNGLFHASTQKIYEYGIHKPRHGFLNRKKTKEEGKQLKVFADICSNIETIVKNTNPQKRIILCVDGSAPVSKQQQQKKRRYKSAKDKTDEEFTTFDSNSLSVGTKYIDDLCKYIDYYIRKSITLNPSWKNLEIIFSDYKVHGEGEQKVYDYIRKYGNLDESFCVHGNDADIIMLSLASVAPKFYVLHDVMYNEGKFHFIDIDAVRNELHNMMKWGNDDVMDTMRDFVMMCFMVGNDFLPHIPSLEIINGGIDKMIEIYKKVGKRHGNLCIKVNGKNVINEEAFKEFLNGIAAGEREMFDNKAMNKGKYYEDLLLESNTNSEGKVNLEQYKEDYNIKNFPDGTDIKSVCHSYIRGLQWVLTYYTEKVPDWRWCYEYFYAPFSTDITEHINSYVRTDFNENIPLSPFKQLLCIIPPKSHTLLPNNMSNLLIDKNSPLKEYCPDKFEIDYSGKKKEWESVVLIKNTNLQLVDELYDKNIKLVDKKDIDRDKVGDVIVYKHIDDDFSTVFKSRYGSITNCKATTSVIVI